MKKHASSFSSLLKLNHLSPREVILLSNGNQRGKCKWNSSKWVTVDLYVSYIPICNLKDITTNHPKETLRVYSFSLFFRIQFWSFDLFFANSAIRPCVCVCLCVSVSESVPLCLHDYSLSLLQRTILSTQLSLHARRPPIVTTTRTFSKHCSFTGFTHNPRPTQHGGSLLCTQNETRRVSAFSPENRELDLTQRLIWE